jgi:DNA-binding transcriptional LysR family regulator
VKLVVGAYPAVWKLLVARALAEALRTPALDGVEVDTHISGDEERQRGILEYLGSGEADVVVAPSDSAITSAISRRLDLYQWRLRVHLPSRNKVRSHPLRGPRIGIDRLAQEQLLVSPPGHASRKLLEAAFGAAGHELQVAGESTNTDALLALSDHRLGICVLPDDATGSKVDSGWPVVITANGDTIGGVYSAWTLTEPASDKQPLIAALLQAMVDVGPKELGDRWIGTVVEPADWARLDSPAAADA